MPKTHGMSKTRFYKTWLGMKKRTCNPNNKDYPRYGGRGIKTCDRWIDFNNFMDDMYETYLIHFNIHGPKQTSLERIDNNKGYLKENCKWATQSEQAYNRGTPKKYLIEGKNLTRLEISTKYNLPITCVKDRIRRNWSLESLIKPVGYKRKRSEYVENK